MYDSKVSNYNIVKMTRFGRDPIAELAAACQKAGLKSGFITRSTAIGTTRMPLVMIITSNAISGIIRK